MSDSEEAQISIKDALRKVPRGADAVEIYDAFPPVRHHIPIGRWCSGALTYIERIERERDEAQRSRARIVVYGEVHPSNGIGTEKPPIHAIVRAFYPEVREVSCGGMGPAKRVQERIRRGRSGIRRGSRGS